MEVMPTPNGSEDVAQLEAIADLSQDQPIPPVWSAVDAQCYEYSTPNYNPSCYERIKLMANDVPDTISYSFFPTIGSTWKFTLIGYDNNGKPIQNGQVSYSVPGNGGPCHFNFANNAGWDQMQVVLTSDDKMIGRSIFFMEEHFQTYLYQADQGTNKGFYFQIPPASGSQNIQKVNFLANGSFYSSMINPSSGGYMSRSSWKTGTKIQAQTILKDGRNILADLTLQ